MNKESYKNYNDTVEVNWFAVLGVIAGAVVANLLKWGIASVNGMVVAVVFYLVGTLINKK